ncbi:MAG: hypothetical protein SPL00_05370 [Bacilli bacterium]|nr:hypothetical protein [Bacilli bacterium]
MPNNSYDNNLNEGNTFYTTDVTDFTAVSRNVANKRIFLVILFLCLVTFGFIIWELVDLLVFVK